MLKIYLFMSQIKNIKVYISEFSKLSKKKMMRAYTQEKVHGKFNKVGKNIKDALVLSSCPFFQIGKLTSA